MKKFLLVVVLLVMLGVTACGGGQPSTSLDVTMVEFTFTPNSFTVPAGEEITLHIVNNGAVLHEFVIMELGTSVGENFGDEDEENIYWEVELQPGGDQTVTFMAPDQPGEYQVVCGTQGHYTAGMIGKLTVVAGEE